MTPNPPWFDALWELPPGANRLAAVAAFVAAESARQQFAASMERLETSVGASAADVEQLADGVLGLADDPITAALERQYDAPRQIRDHDGPVYERHHARTVDLHAAWVEAGSPVRVVVPLAGEPFLYAPWMRRQEIVPATPEQAAAWRAWLTTRAALRRAQA